MNEARSKDKVGTTRDRILEEAEKLFAVRGFEGTGIEEIARNAGIRKSVIYYHFKNKDEILQTLLDEFVTKGVAFKKSLFTRYAGEFMEKLEQVLSEMMDFLEANRRVITIMLMESLKNPDQLPLLDLWSFQSSAAREVVDSASRHGIETVKVFDRGDQGLHEAFFMLSFPIIGYTIFADKWCEQVRYDRKASRDDFIDAYLWYLRERIMKRGDRETG
jgi:AcrR family transcriptional regulator